MAVDEIVLSDDRATLHGIVSNDLAAPLWTRKLHNLITVEAVEAGSCGFIHSLPDESQQLLSDCLNDSLIIIERSELEDCPAILTIAEKKSGTGLYKTCLNSSSIIDVEGSGNRIVVISVNPKDQRQELLLLESFITPEEDMLVQQFVGILPIPKAETFTFTHTTDHITPQSLVVHSSMEGKFYEVSLEPIGYMRRTTAADATPIVPHRPIGFALRNDDLVRESGFGELRCSPTIRESTTICQLGDLKPFELSPVNKFDALPESFSQIQCAGVVTAMMALVGTLLYKIKKAKSKTL